MKPPSYFVRLLDEIRARGLEIPAVLADVPTPLALETRRDLPTWCELRNYDRAACELLDKAIAIHVGSAAYLKAVSNELAIRHDLDGCPVSPVSELDRHTAAMRLYLKEIRAAERAPAKPAPVAEPPLTNSKRPVVRLPVGASR